MSQIIVSPQEVARKKETLTALNNSLKTQIDNLEGLGNNLNSMWEGSAKESYVRNLRVDITQMKILFRAIVEFISVLQQIISLYNLIEKKNIATASS